MDATRFAGKVALVTGAGSGIGRATALRLASEGAKVAAAELSEEGGLETLRLIAETGAKAIFIPTDVSRAADTERMVKETVEAFGGLHILINNAGIYDGKDRKITEIDIDVFRRTLDINLKGMFLSAKYAMPAIVKSGGGAAVLLSSVGAVKGWRQHGLLNKQGRRRRSHASPGGTVRTLRRACERYPAGAHRDPDPYRRARSCRPAPRFRQRHGPREHAHAPPLGPAGRGRGPDSLPCLR
jgi:NAD(P)-dependent dehydrogenase (short-subunit alcohol dehydrogenase family)